MLHLIHHEEFSPGDRLPTERELAERFGTSRVSIRTALNRLDALGVVELRPRSGIYVHPDPLQRSIECLVLMEEAGLPISHEQILHAVEIRSLLELEAIKLACRRRTNHDLARIHDALRESQATLLEGGNLANLDPKFHLALITAAHNPVLTHFVASFYRMSKRRRDVFFADPEQNLRSHRQHVRLCEAVEDRDEEKAVSLLEEHLVGVGEYFEQLSQNIETE